MSILPEDVHEFIIPYLPFTNIVHAYQLTCKLWFTIANEKVTRIDLRESRTQAVPQLLLLLNSRYTNLEVLHLDTKMYNLAPLKYLTNCHKLGLVYDSDGIPCSAEHVDIELFYTNFPRYKAYNVTPTRTFSLEKHVEALSRHQPSHVIISHRSHKSLYTLFQVVLPHATHLYHRSHDDVEVLYLMQPVMDAILEYLPSKSSLEHIQTLKFVNHQWIQIIQRSPKLLSYDGFVNVDHAVAFLEHCPLLRTLKMRYGDANHRYASQNIITTLKSVKELEAISFTVPLVQSGQKLESFSCNYTSELLQESISHLKHVKNLDVAIQDSVIDDVVNNCTMLETVSVNNSTSELSVKKLILGCPSLRYINGSGYQVTFEKDKYGVIDVIRAREQLPVEERPPKRQRH